MTGIFNHLKKAAVTIFATIIFISSFSMPVNVFGGDEISITFIYGGAAYTQQMTAEIGGQITAEMLDEMSAACPDPMHVVAGWYTDPDFTHQWDCDADTVTEDLTFYGAMDYSTLGVLSLGDGNYYKNGDFYYGYKIDAGSRAIVSEPSGVCEYPGPVERQLSESGMEVYKAPIKNTTGAYVKFYIENEEIVKLYYFWEKGDSNGYYTKCWYVKYDANGAPPIAKYSGYLVHDGEKAVRPPQEGIPSRQGYKFIDWYTQKADGEKYDFSSVVHSSFSIYAHWQSRVDYDYNYSVDGKPVGIKYTEWIDETKTASYPDVSRTGYTFTGWYLDAECRTPADKSAPIAGETVFYAGWKANECKVSFEMQGHGKQKEQITAAYDSLIASFSTPDDGLYVLEGWYKEKECKNRWDFDGDIVKGDMTLYAKWYDPCTVSFVFPNGKTEEKTIKHGGSLTAPSAPEDWYTIGGWYKDSGLSQEWDFQRDCVERDMTLYALVYPDCQVEFNMNGHGVAPDSQTVKFGEKVKKPEDPADEELALFKGWYKDAACTQEWNFDTDTAPASNLTIYAGWTELTYVVLDPQNGDGADFILETIGKPISGIIPKYTYGSKYLVGWFSDREYKNHFEVKTDPVTENLTLFAKWADPCKVIFDYGGGVTEERSFGIGESIWQADLDDMSQLHKDAEGYKKIYGWCKDAALKEKWMPGTDEAAEGMILYADWGYTRKGIFHIGDGQSFKCKSYDDGGLRINAEGELLSSLLGGIGYSVGEVQRTGDVYKAYLNGTDSTYAEFTVKDDKVTNLYFYYTKGNRNGNYTPCWYVEFNANGGGTGFAAYNGCLVYDGEKASPPKNNPVWDDHTFEYFCSDQACTTKYNWNTAVHGDFTIYAKYQGEMTVKFDMQGHGTAPDPIKVQSGGTIKLPSAPTADDYHFLGWYSDKECTKLWDENTQVLANTTIYAGWSYHILTITYDANGHGTAPDPADTEYGMLITEPEAPDDKLYTFDGWYREAACKNAWDFSTDTAERNLTLYAKWLDPCTVKFEVRGEEAYDAAAVKIGSTVSEPEEGSGGVDSWYTIEGWYREKSFTTRWDFANDKVTSDMTLYGLARSYCQVKYDMQGHGTAPHDEFLPYNSKIEKPEDPEAGDGELFRFDGWYKDSGFKEAWNFAKDRVPEDELTLYAKWVEQTFVSLNPGGGFSPEAFLADMGVPLDSAVYSSYTKEYEFIEGWYTDEGLTQYFDIKKEAVTENLSLFARWAGKSTVMFDFRRDGIKVQTFAEADKPIRQQTFDEMNTMLSDDGRYTLLGWYKDADCTQAWDASADKAYDGLVLYADWAYTTKGLIDLSKSHYFASEGYVLMFRLDNNKMYYGPFSFVEKLGEAQKISENEYRIFVNGSEAQILTYYLEDGKISYLHYKYGNSWEYDVYECWCVFFDWNGGGGYAQDEGCLVFDGETARKPGGYPTWADHEFEYYCIDQACTTEYDWDTPVHENFSIYAKWNGMLTVTFDTNGYGIAPDPIKVQSGSTIRLPENPFEKGYVFTGWYRDAGCTKKFDSSEPIYANTTLYAGWEKFGLSSISVSTAPVRTLYFEGESFDPAGMVVTASYNDGSSKTVESYEYSPDGVLTKENRKIEISYTELGTTKSCEQVVEVKPVGPYKVTFDTNGHGTAPEEQNITYPDRAKEPEALSEEGYIFNGWFTDKSCTEKFDFSTPLTADITLYAGWKAGQYTVTFDANGHGRAPSDQVITFPGKVSKPDDPSAEGFEFKGWYTDADCTVEYDFNQSVSKSFTLYALWDIYREYTISFGTWGQEIPEPVMTVSHKLEALPAVNTPDGLSFVQWLDSDDVPVTTDKVYTEDTMLYAEYSIDKAAVTITPPSVGEEFDMEPVYSGQASGLDRTPVEWFVLNDGEFVPVESTATDLGCTYKVTIKAHSVNYYHFNKNLKVDFNGEDVVPEISPYYVQDLLQVSYVFDALPDHICEGMLVEKDKTCSEDGVKAHYECTFEGCGKWFEDEDCTKEIPEDEKAGYVIPAAHTWEAEYTTDKEADCTEEGMRSIHCSKCDAVKDECVIPKLMHAETDWKSDEDGHWTTCEVCNSVVSKKAGHEDSDEDGKCDVCGYITGAPKPVVYKIIEGAESKWARESSEGLRFRSDAPYDKFFSVEVDGTVVPEENYNVSEGSTIVDFRTVFLNSLALGRHSLTIVSTDGSASTNFTIYKEGAVPTGDAENAGFFLVMVLLCIACVSAAAFRKAKNR